MLMRLLPLFLLFWSHVSLQDESLAFTVRTFKPKTIKQRHHRSRAFNEINLKRHAPRASPSRNRELLHALHSSNSSDGVHHSSGITSAALGQDFLTSISIGSQWFEAMLDTGSSDTWIVRQGFECVDNTSQQPLAEQDCHFGSIYFPSSTVKIVAGQNFNISYGSGEFCTGKMAHDKVTLANITVANQEFGLVNYASWFGDGVGSGIIGLAYSSLTSAYAGDNPMDDVRHNVRNYPSLFTSMIKQGVPPMFSLALYRGSLGGVLAIGGLPQRYQLPPSAFTSTDIQILEILPYAETASRPSFYTVYIDGFAYDNAHGNVTADKAWNTPFQPRVGTVKRADVIQNFVKTADIPAVVDSGTSINFIPTEIAQDVNSNFSPPAAFDPAWGFYLVECNATAPTFGVVIKETIFYINAQDMFVEVAHGVCASGIQAGSSRFMILGDVFLKNVLAVFDVGASEMRFAAREYH